MNNDEKKTGSQNQKEALVSADDNSSTKYEFNEQSPHTKKLFTKTKITVFVSLFVLLFFVIFFYSLLDTSDTGYEPEIDSTKDLESKYKEELERSLEIYNSRPIQASFDDFDYERFSSAKANVKSSKEKLEKNEITEEEFLDDVFNFVDLIDNYFKYIKGNTGSGSLEEVHEVYQDRDGSGEDFIESHRDSEMERIKKIYSIDNFQDLLQSELSEEVNEVNRDLAEKIVNYEKLRTSDENLLQMFDYYYDVHTEALDWIKESKGVDSIEDLV